MIRNMKVAMRKIGVLLMLGEIFLLTISVRSSNGQFAGSIVYDPGDDHIWIMNVDDSQRVSVTDGQGEINHPAWFPDGEEIALASNRDGSGDIYIVNSNGTELRQVTRDATLDICPDWSPDGQKIVYSSDFQISVIDVDGGKSIQLTHTNVDKGILNEYPTWSPRGNEIAYKSNGQIWVMDTDGKNAEQLTDNLGQSTQPAWSPDGDRLAYMHLDISEEWDVSLIGRDGKGLRRIRMRGTIERSPRWLPDEHHIVFVSKTWGGNVQRDGMYVVNVNDTLRPKLLNKVTANWIDWIDVIVPSLGMSPNSLTAVIWGQIKKSLSD